VVVVIGGERAGQERGGEGRGSREVVVVVGHF